MNTSKAHLRIAGLAGFILAAMFAVTEDWNLQEFCWSTWLAGLIYTWACVLIGGSRILLTGQSGKSVYDTHLPILRRVHPVLFLFGLAAVLLPAGWLLMTVYSYLFGFYGLFLSVFAEMPPHNLFGGNGFINSDFYTPVVYLLRQFWPMALGTLISAWSDFFRYNPWMTLALPFQRKVMRLHFFILVMPFLTLGAWALFGDKYHSVTIILLMGLFYLFPETDLKETFPGMPDSHPPQETEAP